MAFPIGQGKRIVGELYQIRPSANGLKLPFRRQTLGKRNLVDRYMTKIQLKHAFENTLMSRPEEVLRSELCRNFIDSIRIQHAGGQNRLFSLYVARQGSARCGLQNRRRVVLSHVISLRLSRVCGKSSSVAILLHRLEGTMEDVEPKREAGGSLR